MFLLKSMGEKPTAAGAAEKDTRSGANVSSSSRAGQNIFLFFLPFFTVDAVLEKFASRNKVREWSIIIQHKYRRCLVAHTVTQASGGLV